MDTQKFHCELEKFSIHVLSTIFTYSSLHLYLILPSPTPTPSFERKARKKQLIRIKEFPKFLQPHIEKHTDRILQVGRIKIADPRDLIPRTEGGGLPR